MCRFQHLLYSQRHFVYQKMFPMSSCLFVGILPFRQLSLPQLTSMLSKMKETQKKMEIAIQQIQKVIYSKRSSEILQPNHVNPLSISSFNKSPEKSGPILQVMFSEEDDNKEEKPQNTISDLQSRLTGGLVALLCKYSK